ncbi:DUF4399 domain-containing protein [Pseudoflavitalea sp. G-6-1-2]|uniref:DUF4399 domain-containing protein n=1 Tax=Pseudoflavitalea sp. G-6-1-2 TaxID=2728841 RepID=UPI00146C12AE|nr:DUF4399 domain-containing protein [Pseudoflavitalea sp. G-6-1-2]NML20474.1 DUF4399 domain-containing protein [Pseudoflavitalea sp. G-6-1-2]
MRKFHFIPALMILGVVACNDAATDSKTPAADTTSHAGHDHASAPGTEIAPVPEIPAGAKVYFKNLKDGQTVTSPFKVEFGADNLSVDTANGIIKPASGHHHVLIGLDSIASGTVVPKDSVHLHFGNAQKETELTLAPGKHKIALQFADGLHRSYGSKLSATITVEVKK